MQVESFGIATSAMLVELSISCWTARKLDKGVSEEIDAVKNTKARAGNYHKRLLADASELDAVLKYAAATRLQHNKYTMPWSDSGPRLVPMGIFMEYKKYLTEREEGFNALVNGFRLVYPTLISAAAFKLNELFNRDDYPSGEEVASKFKFSYVFSPVPTTGDFRVDINEEAKRELQLQYETHFNDKTNKVMREAWDRLHGCLSHMSERLASNEDGTRKIFHSTILTNAQEQVALLSHFNIMKDPELEAARKLLAETLLSTDLDTLKESDEAREATKNKVDAILNKFEW